MKISQQQQQRFLQIFGSSDDASQLQPKPRESRVTKEAPSRCSRERDQSRGCRAAVGCHRAERRGESGRGQSAGPGQARHDGRRVPRRVCPGPGRAGQGRRLSPKPKSATTSKTVFQHRNLYAAAIMLLEVSELYRPCANGRNGLGATEGLTSNVSPAFICVHLALRGLAWRLLSF